MQDARSKDRLRKGNPSRGDTVTGPRVARRRVLGALGVAAGADAFSRPIAGRVLR